MLRATVSVSSTGPPSVAVTAARFERATLTLRDSDEPPLHCQFNPSEYTVTKSATWTRRAVWGALSAPIPEFVGTNAATMTVELFFDERQEEATGVSESVNRLLSWTQPSPRSIDRQAPCPPVVAFEWGGTALFDAYLSSASARYVLFRRDGTPIRAHVTLRLEELPVVLPGTNPTSGSDTLVRNVTVRTGESLPLIAFREYGRADDWRAIAEASDIDDPARLAAGSALVIPELHRQTGQRGRAR